MEEMNCPKCNEPSLKAPEEQDYSYYDYFCPFCEIYFGVLINPDDIEKAYQKEVKE